MMVVTVLVRKVIIVSVISIIRILLVIVILTTTTGTTTMTSTITATSTNTGWSWSSKSSSSCILFRTRNTQRQQQQQQERRVLAFRTQNNNDNDTTAATVATTAATTTRTEAAVSSWDNTDVLLNNNRNHEHDNNNNNNHDVTTIKNLIQQQKQRKLLQYYYYRILHQKQQQKQQQQRLKPVVDDECRNSNNKNKNRNVHRQTTTTTATRRDKKQKSRGTILSLHFPTTERLIQWYCRNHEGENSSRRHQKTNHKSNQKNSIPSFHRYHHHRRRRHHHHHHHHPHDSVPNDTFITTDDDALSSFSGSGSSSNGCSNNVMAGMTNPTIQYSYFNNQDNNYQNCDDVQSTASTISTKTTKVAIDTTNSRRNNNDNQEIVSMSNIDIRNNKNDVDDNVSIDHQQQQWWPPVSSVLQSRNNNRNNNKNNNNNKKQWRKIQYRTYNIGMGTYQEYEHVRDTILNWDFRTIATTADDDDNDNTIDVSKTSNPIWKKLLIRPFRNIRWYRQQGIITIPNTIYHTTDTDDISIGSTSTLSLATTPPRTSSTAQPITWGQGRQMVTYTSTPMLTIVIKNNSNGNQKILHWINRYLIPKLFVINPVSVLYAIVDQCGTASGAESTSMISSTSTPAVTGNSRTTYTSTAYGTGIGHWLCGEERVTVCYRHPQQHDPAAVVNNYHDNDINHNSNTKRIHSTADSSTGGSIDIEIISYSKPSSSSLMGQIVYPIIQPLQHSFFQSQMKYIIQDLTNNNNSK